MSFYNPYSKYPDFGGGMQDIASMLMQWYMMKKMFPDTKKSGSDMPATTVGDNMQSRQAWGDAISQAPSEHKERTFGDAWTSQAPATMQDRYFETPEERKKREDEERMKQMIKYMQMIGRF